MYQTANTWFLATWKRNPATSILDGRVALALTGCSKTPLTFIPASQPCPGTTVYPGFQLRPDCGVRHPVLSGLCLNRVNLPPTQHRQASFSTLPPFHRSTVCTLCRAEVDVGGVASLLYYHDNNHEQQPQACPKDLPPLFLHHANPSPLLTKPFGPMFAPSLSFSSAYFSTILMQDRPKPPTVDSRGS